MREKKDSRQEIVQYLLQQSVSYSVSNETIGGLFTEISGSDNLLLDVLVENWGREKAWDCIERAISTHKDLDKLPILHQTIRHSPRYCTDVINQFPNSGSVRDSNSNNRLPIHVALEVGMKWSLELIYLIKCSQKDLREVDPVTKLPPFVLAAMGTSCDLKTIYKLVREYPQHVELYIPIKNRKKRKVNERCFWLI